MAVGTQAELSLASFDTSLNLRTEMGQGMGSFCIVNIEDIRAFAQTEAKRLPLRAHREWLERAVLRHIVNVQDSLQPSSPTRTELAAPHVSRALAAGEATLRFEASTKLALEVANVVDWLAGLRERDPKLDRKLRRIAFADARAMSLRWHEQLRKEAERKYVRRIRPDPVGAPAVLDEPSLGPGWSWVWLKSPEARKAESDAMGHCVGRGGYESLRSSEAILSLRDPGGVPHVTLQLGDGRILQAVTKGNGKIPPRYREAIHRSAAIVGTRLLVNNNPERAIPDGGYRRNGHIIHVWHGLLHRDHGPAIERADGTRWWYRGGQRHREDGPAIERSDGTKAWYRHGRLCRHGAPAIEWADGTQEWYRHGLRHREDGPAVEWTNGTKEWWHHGQLHREDGPAVEWADGHRWWYRNGEVHHKDGPVIESANAEWADGMKEWLRKGRRTTRGLLPKFLTAGF